MVAVASSWSEILNPMSRLVHSVRLLGYLPILALGGYVLPFAAFLIKPADYPIFWPATPPLLAQRATLRAAQTLYWAAGPVDAAAAVSLTVALRRSLGKRTHLAAGLLVTLGGLCFWLWLLFFLDAG
jgi:hypothetical protein